MLETTKAIVLNTVKYGDSSLIASCYTMNCGKKSYMLKGILKSKKSKLKSAYFQPLTQLNITARHNNKGHLNSIRDIHVENPYVSIYSSIKKQTIALFLAEVLSYSIQEEERNPALYTYLETSLLWLENHDEIANFHLLFLLRLTKFLGFYPELNIEGNTCFDMIEGKFSRNFNLHCISGNDFVQFKKLLGINFDVLHKVDFNASNRYELLLILIQYFELHLSGFKRPKSLSVLRSVFN